MTLAEQIDSYLASIPDPKRGDVERLHQLILRIAPSAQLWYTNGTNEQGKIVSNPQIGYGLHTTQYANGSTRDTFRVGLSANAAGISIYIFGLNDKTYLSTHYGPKIGKANVTGYCIKFKSINDIDIDVLRDSLVYGLTQSTPL